MNTQSTSNLFLAGLAAVRVSQNPSPETFIPKPEEKENKPLSALQQTRSDQFVEELFAKRIIDTCGKLNKDVCVRLPAHDVELIKSLTDFLEQDLFIEIGDKKGFYRDLFESLKALKLIDEDGKLVHGIPNDQSSFDVFIGNHSITYKQLVNCLIDRGVIDRDGNLKTSLSSETESTLPKLKNEMLWRFLHKEKIRVLIGNKRYCSAYIKKKELIHKIAEQFDQDISSIKIVGGRARKRMIEVPGYSKQAFKEMFKELNLEYKDDLIVDDLFADLILDEVPDDDIKFAMVTDDGKKLLSVSDYVVSCISNLLFEENGDNHKQWIIEERGFNKLNHIFNGGDHYVIASIANFEAMGCASLKRRQLFSDEVEEDVSGLFKKGDHSSPFFVSDKVIGLQGLICILGQYFHLDDPIGANENAFPLVISRLTRGKQMQTTDALDVLLKKKEMTFDDLVPSFIYHLEQHHPSHLNHAALAYTYTACNFLLNKFSQSETEDCWKKIDEAFSLKSTKISCPILSTICNLVVHGKAPYNIVNAFIQAASFLRLGFCLPCDEKKEVSVFIREIQSSPVIQIQIRHQQHRLSIWTTLTPQEAIEKIAAYMKDASVSNDVKATLTQLFEEIWLSSLTNHEAVPILARYKQIRQLDVKSLEGTAQNLLKETDGFCKYLGYCLLITIGECETNKFQSLNLVAKFSEAFSFQTNSTSRQLLFKQLIYVLNKTEYAKTVQSNESPLHIFAGNAREDHPPEKIQMQWIEALAETGEIDFCQVSYDLWNQFSVTSKTQETLSRLFSSFVKSSSSIAQALLEYSQHNEPRLPFDKEMRAIGSLMHAYKQRCVKEHAVENPLSLGKMIQAFLDRPLPDLKAPQNVVTAFTPCFIWFVDQCISHAFLNLGYSLMSSAEKKAVLESNHELRSLWVKITELVLADGPERAFETWNQAMTLNVWPKGFFDEKLYQLAIGLALQFSLDPDRTKDFEKLLDFLNETSFPSNLDLKQVQKLMVSYITRLIEQNQFDDARKKIATFNKILTKTQTILCWITLCREYCNVSAIDNALAIWEKLVILETHKHYTTSIQELSNHLLDKLWDVQSFTLIAKMLASPSQNSCSKEKKVHFFKKCLPSLLEGSAKEDTLLFELTTELLKHCEEQNRELQSVDADLASLVMDFIKQKWKPGHGMPETLIEHLNRFLPILISQMRLLDKYSELYDLLHHFHLHLFDVNISEESAKIFLWALAKKINVESQDVKNDFQLFEWLRKHFPEALEKDYLPLYSSFGATFIASQSPHEAAQFFIQNRNSLVKASSLSQCKEKVVSILDPVLNAPPNESIITTGYHLLHDFDISESRLWITWLESTLNQEEQKGIDSAWDLFNKHCRGKPAHERLWTEVLNGLNAILLKRLENKPTKRSAVFRRALTHVVDGFCERGNNEEIIKVKTLLNHLHALAALGKSSYSYLWGKILLASIDHKFPNPTFTDKCNIAFHLLMHHELICYHSDTEEICIRKVIDIILEQLNNNNKSSVLFVNFMDQLFITLANTCSNITYLSKDERGRIEATIDMDQWSRSFSLSGKSQGKLLIYTKDSSKDPWIIPTYECSEDSKTPHAAKFKDQYFKYMTIIFNKSIASSFEGIQFDLLHSFMIFHLKVMLKSFADKKKEFPKMISDLVYWVLPELNAFMPDHENITSKLTLEAFQSGCFTDCPDKVVELLFYLKKPQLIPLELRSSKYQDAALKAIDVCIKMESMFSIDRAICIWKEIHQWCSTHKFETAFLQKSLQLIIQKSKPHFFYCISGIGNDETMSNQLCKLVIDYNEHPDTMLQLLDMGYQLSLEPSTMHKEAGLFSPNYAIEWLMRRFSQLETLNLLIVERRDEGCIKYYQFINKIYPSIQKYLSQSEVDPAEVANRLAKILVAPRLINHSQVRQLRDEILVKYWKFLFNQKNEALVTVAKNFSKEMKNPNLNLMSETKTIFKQLLSHCKHNQ